MEKLARRNELLYRALDQEGIIFDPKTDMVHCLNQTAAMIWELLDGHHNLNDIVKVIISKFKVETDKAIADVEKALEDFRQLGLLSDQKDG